MQMNEELIKKIVDAVMEQIGQLENKTDAKPSAEVSSLAGRERINKEKTDYVFEVNVNDSIDDVCQQFVDFIIKNIVEEKD